MKLATQESSQPEILEYQRELQRRGFYLGPLDGKWGPKTERADTSFCTSGKPPRPSEATPAGSSSALEQVRARILSIAGHFVNLTEVSQNARWDDLTTSGPDARASELRTLLLTTGWQPGWAYCAAFADVCWRYGYAGRPELPLISRSITLSAMGTLENFERLHRVTKTPQPGALMLLQHGDSWQGHAGIVLATDRSGWLETIEGNTNPAGGREGDGVYRKKRELDFSKHAGLWLRGFVNPFLI